jgi:DNA-binding CsgD family transcriptional regulator
VTTLRELQPAVDILSLDSGSSETMLTRFLDGEEHVAESMIRLALDTGDSLVHVYEQIRSCIAAATGVSNEYSLLENELDESLVRLVARLRPPIRTRLSRQACILSIEGRGVPACIAHLMLEAGMSAVVVGSASGGSTKRGAAAVALLLSSVDYVVIDGSRALPAAIDRTLRLMNHLDFVGSGTGLLLLSDPGPLPDQTYDTVLPDLVHVGSLINLMTALGIASENPLTIRERDVLRHVANGETNDQVARRLDVALSTVKTYLERIHVKLKSNDRASAVATAMLRKWL